jgi:RNA polymerase sigma factor (sigma-70 family)
MTHATSHRVRDLPPVPRLDHPSAIRTEQGINTLRVYMMYMKRKHNLRVVHPFTFEDMFQDAYAFLLERVDQWNPELMMFDGWATEMLRYGWLYAVRDMHWLKYRVIDKQHQIEGRRMTRFAQDETGIWEQDKVADPSDDFDTLIEDDELENLLSQLEPRDRKIIELLLEGRSGREIQHMTGATDTMRDKARARAGAILGLKRPRPMHTKYEQLTEKDRQRVLREYERLGSKLRVSANLRITKAVVSEVLERAR